MGNCDHRYAEAVYDKQDIVLNEKSKENEVRKGADGKPVHPKKVVCRECGEQLPAGQSALGIGGAA